MPGTVRTLGIDLVMVFVVDQAFLNIPEGERVRGDGSVAPISLSLLSDLVGFVLEDLVVLGVGRILSGDQVLDKTIGRMGGTRWARKVFLCKTV